MNKNFNWGSILKYLLFFLFIIGFLWAPKLFNIADGKVFQYSGLACAIIFFLYLLLVDYWGRKNDKEKTNSPDEKSRNRTFITIWMVTVGFIIVIVFGVLVYNSENNDENAKWVFNATVPLIASWIGTVLAFYFGRENFESATDRILQFSRKQLDDIFVERMMISKKTMLNLIYENGKTLNLAKQNLATVDEIIKFYKGNGKDRIPLLDENSKPLYIFHLARLNQADPTKSLKDFLNQPESKDLYGHNQNKGFITVSARTTLENATKKRLAVENCKDIFVTKNGTANSEVLGWVTDSLAERFLSFEKK